MVYFKDIEVTVQVNDVDLKEYEDEDEAGNHDNKTVSKYVEAVSGAPFAIKARLPKGYKMTSNALTLRVIVDGTHEDKIIVQETDLKKKHGDWVSYRTGTHTFTGTYSEHRKWHFSEIKLLEEATHQSQLITPTLLKSLGVISVQFYRKHVIGPASARSYEDKDQYVTQPNLELTEKKLKGGSLTHSTSLGEATIKHRRIGMHSTYIDGIDCPIAVFKFKYRSKRALQSLLLIPRSPSPGPVLPLEERDVDTLNPQELQELARRHQARYRQEQRSAVKPERRGIKREREQAYDDDDDDVTVVDTSAKRAKARPSAGTEVVDLTG